jgi:hypothetical protein
MDEIALCAQEMYHLRMYANESMQTISNIYKCRQHAFAPDMFLCNPSHRPLDNTIPDTHNSTLTTREEYSDL